MIIVLSFENIYRNYQLSIISNWIATVFRIGFLPLAPGTWCSLFAVVVWYFLLVDISVPNFSLIIIIVTILGVFTSNQYIEDSGKDDPSEVVIDELAGQWLALLGIPHSIGFAFAALIIFRIFDIAKPFPIKQLEKFPRGWGVMLDDIGAGILTCGILQLYMHIV